MSLLRENFVPLYNFQAGNDNFKNTCFIAVVANLRHVLQPVMESVQQYNWKDYINYVRSNWNAKYEFAPEHNGQHDAAELLGDIMFAHRFLFGVEVCVCRQIYECNHIRERSDHLAMIVLSLPIQRGRFTLRRLRDDYFTPMEVNALMCEECGISDVNGICTHTYRRSVSGKVVFRINRYTAQGRRSDPVTLDEQLTFEGGDKYSLQAIVQHEGESIHGGHYIMYLKSNGKWECRNDQSRTFYDAGKLPPYTPENVYLVVYALSSSNGSSASSGSADPLDVDFWENIPEDSRILFPPRSPPTIGGDWSDCWKNIPEDLRSLLPDRGPPSIGYLSDSTSSDGSSDSDSSEVWINIPEEPERDIAGIGADAYDPWINIPEEHFLFCFF